MITSSTPLDNPCTAAPLDAAPPAQAVAATDAPAPPAPADGHAPCTMSRPMGPKTSFLASLLLHAAALGLLALAAIEVSGPRHRAPELESFQVSFGGDGPGLSVSLPRDGVPSPVTSEPEETTALIDPPVLPTPPQFAALPDLAPITPRPTCEAAEVLGVGGSRRVVDHDRLPPPAPAKGGPSLVEGGRAGVIGPSAAGGNLPPRYPDEARRKGWEGTVLVAALVGADGAVRSVRVERSSGHPCLDDAAIEAARDWRFSPATLDGAPVEEEVQVPIRFVLQ